MSQQYKTGFGQGQGVDFGDGGTYDDLYTGSDFIQPPSSESYAAPSGTMQPALQEFPGMEHVDVEQPQQPLDDGKPPRMWDLRYYSFLFDVDTNEVLARLARSVVPFSVNFLASVQNNPDMYGPFWVVTTLIFLNAGAGNFAMWIHQGQDFRYHFEEVTFGAAAFYSYVTIMPILLWIAFKWFEVPVTLLQAMCIYGYSMFIYLPVAILCIIPSEILRWLLIFGAGAWSLLFLLMNFYPPLFKDKLQDKKATTLGGAILAVVAVCHMALALTIKLYFFHYAD